MRFVNAILNNATKDQLRILEPLKEGQTKIMSNKTQAAEFVDVLGISVRIDYTMAGIVNELVSRAKDRIRTDVAFVNTDCINIAQRDHEYVSVLERQDYVLPDGIGVKIGAMFKGVKPRDNINGTDMLPVLCKDAIKHKQSVYFLGAKPGVAERMKQELLSKYPEFQIAGTHHGYFQADETARIIEQINASAADFLLVAFGAPRQEKWLQEYGDSIQVPVRVGVGGLFDFFSGDMRRAPFWMRSLGLEWLFRLMLQPRVRFNRYVIGSPLFVVRLLIERLRSK